MVRCEYLGTDVEPTQVTFCLSAQYRVYTARETHDWFLRMMQELRSLRWRRISLANGRCRCSETVRGVLVV